VGKRGPHPVDPSYLLSVEDAWYRTFRDLRDWKTHGFISGPGERELWEELKKAHSAKQVQKICRRSKYWLNPHWKGGYFIGIALPQQASGFVTALKHKRCPRSDRPSSDDKRMRFLAKAMTAAVTGRSVRTVEDLLPEARSRVEQEFQCSCGHLKQEHCLTAHRTYCTKSTKNLGHCVFCMCTKYKYGGIRQARSG